jgi:hypothetical protein
VPVDRWIRFYLNVAMHLSLAGKADVLFRVAEQFQTEQWIDPLVDPFQEALLTAVFAACFEGNIATAACSKPHAVHNFVGARIQLHAVLASNCSDILTILRFNGNLFVDKLNCGHDEFAFGKSGDSDRNTSTRSARYVRILTGMTFPFQISRIVPASGKLAVLSQDRSAIMALLRSPAIGSQLLQGNEN